MKNFLEDVTSFAVTKTTVTRDVTVAATEIEVDGAIFTGVGQAKRESGDKFNREIGVKLAHARSLEALAKQLKKQAEGLVTNSDNEKQHKKQLRKAEKKKAKLSAK